MPDLEVPVLIVGGSLVGMSAAMLLGHHGIRATVVEHHRGTASCSSPSRLIREGRVEPVLASDFPLIAVVAVSEVFRFRYYRWKSWGHRHWMVRDCHFGVPLSCDRFDLSHGNRGDRHTPLL